jgi:serine protease Do
MPLNTELASLLIDLRASSQAQCQADPGSPGCQRAMSLQSASESFAPIVAAVLPSVVQLDVSFMDPAFTLARRAVGSGIILSADGYVLTNAHVVAGSVGITAHLADGRSVQGVLIGHDSAADLAVVKLAATGLAPAAFGDSGLAKVGDVVLAIGSPFGLGQTVTSGILSATDRSNVVPDAAANFLQTDAAINPGNSGGPLVNMQGQVIGVNTLIVARGQGIGFAVPSNAAVQIAQRIVTHPEPQAPPPPTPPLVEKAVSKFDYRPFAAATALVLVVASLVALGRSG